MRKGLALVISAPSGAGKSTLSKMLLDNNSNLCFSVSCTTRAIRPNEKHGKDYFFISKEEFEKKRRIGEFAEWAEVHGNLYGTPLAPVKEMLSLGRDVLFDVDIQGAAQIKMVLPDACFIFIIPPSMAELKNRMLARATDTEEDISTRLANAKLEISQASWFDAIILNDYLEKAYHRLEAVYLSAGLVPSRNPVQLAALLEEKI